MAEITEHDRKEVMAKAISQKPAWWQNRYMDALERIKAPGEFDELAEIGPAAIEADRPHSVAVYVCDDHGTESRDMSPGEARRLAFELLVLADLAEAAQPSQKGDS